ncbi:MAG TPA: pyruvate:ferredoxin (flavodoxin) oxidoreductase, partial [Planctomycetota bacterium]|nr:pyruvate:ferredoxin (flavodoxin) oxidoreductase [Planctomycetota bacterium]
AETCAETVRHLVARGEKVGLVIVRLYRPFSADRFLAAVPQSVRSIAVLDRTKEPGALGEPLFQEVLTCVAEAFSGGAATWKALPRVIGGRYGLSSKEFTPAMAARVFEELGAASPRPRFTVGIEDDVTHLSLDVREDLDVLPSDVYQAVFIGLGADGTVSANKNSIKILGESTDLFAQGYFVYDSKKAGSVTVSHLRFGKSPIRAPYLIGEADFVGCHQLQFLLEREIASHARPGAVLLINAPHAPHELWRSLPADVAREAIGKRLKVFVIDAYKIARETGLGARINTIMQTCFFKISGIMPLEQAIAAVKDAVQKTYGKKGEEIVTRNFAAIDRALEGLQAVPLPESVDSQLDFVPPVPAGAPAFVREFTARIIQGQGNLLPVSRIPCDGTFPTGTSRWEKRNIAQEIPVWDMETCIQCGKCVLVCPHTAIRMKAYDPSALEGCPETFLSTAARGKELEGQRFTLQTAPEDCTGCGICVHVCPARNKRETRLKAIYMMPQAPLRAKERDNYDFFLRIPERDRRTIDIASVRGSQFLEPLFEASGACAGCGETPYLRILTQLYGDRLIVANATGCSSIYGGNLPTTPWSFNRDGRGPAWSNSLFEDNAEFGLGIRLAADQQRDQARALVQELEPWIGEDLVRGLLQAPQADEADLHEQRLRVAALRQKLEPHRKDRRLARLLDIVDYLVEKTVWIVGGDGWAYDIGFGGLDHILASGRKVRVLVLDTEVYSNTGGQMSKSTPRGAVAKFAASGKATAKKDLALLAMSYRNVYVARVAFGANDGQTVKALIEAEQHDGPSIIIAYSHCIAHGINMRTALDNHKAAVQSGHWPLCRYNPAWGLEGKSPLKLDSQKPKIPFAEYASREARYTMLQKSHPDTARRLLAEAQQDVDARWRLYEQLAESPCGVAAALAGSKE